VSMHETSGAYAEAKEPWFDAALPRAEEWAGRVGWSPSP
jgi:dephospho-CoA kinase